MGINKWISLTILFIVISFKAFTQVSIQFVDTNKMPIIGVVVQINNNTNTLSASYQITDSLGKTKAIFSFDNSYLITATHIGYKPFKGIIQPTNDLIIIEMVKSIKQLQEVTVIAEKLLIRQEEDKIIIDADQLSMSSTSGLDILEKTPGIIVDTEGNFYLSTTTPATIYINGREQKISGIELINVLKNLPSNSVEKIEIMRTPSAKYDASTAGGAINIILKKGVKIGIVGSVSLGANKGKFNEQTLGISFSNNFENKMSYISFNLNKKNSYEDLLTTRKISEQLGLSQKNYTTYPFLSFYSGFGYGILIKKKWDVNFDGIFSYNPNQVILNGKSNEYLNNSILNDIATTTNNDIVNISSNLSAITKFKIDTIGSELATNFSHIYSSKSSIQNSLEVSDRTQIIDTNRANFISKRFLFSAQLDLTLKYNYVKIESGLKSSSMIFNSTLSNFSLNLRKYDNSYKYDETISAFYIILSKNISKINVKGGLRFEKTLMNGETLMNSSFVINRTDFFPYFHLSTKIKTILGYDFKGFLVLRSAITRPSFDYLNPSKLFINHFLYQVGNPSLTPQLTYAYEANISVDDVPLFALGRSYSKDVFSSVVYSDENNSTINYSTYDNIGEKEEIYIRASAGIPPTSRYFFILMAQYSINKIIGTYQNSFLHFRRSSWKLYALQKFKINDMMNVTLQGFAIIGGQQQLYTLENFGGLNFTLNRSFFNKKVNFSLYVNDILYTNKTNFNLEQGVIQITGERLTDSQRFGFNIRYNIGFKKLEKNNIFDVENNVQSKYN